MARLSLPGSSALSSLVSSRTVSRASLSRHECEDELESYLSLVASGREKSGRGGKGDRRRDAEIDWSRLLDGQYDELQACEDEEDLETESEADVQQFLKPKSRAKQNPTPEHNARKGKDSPEHFTIPESGYRQPHTDLTESDSISMSDLSSNYEPEHRAIHRGHTLNATRVSPRAAEPPDNKQAHERKTESEVNQNYSTSTAPRPQIALNRSVSTSSSDEDTSDVSMPQELALSSHFKNVFTLDQLQPIQSSNNSGHNQTIVQEAAVSPASGECSGDDSNGKEGGQLHNVVSFTELESVPVGSSVGLLGRDNTNEEGSPHYNGSASDLVRSEEEQADVETASEEVNSANDTPNSYEEDFEDETLEDAAVSQSCASREHKEESERARADSTSESEYSTYRDHTHTEGDADKDAASSSESLINSNARGNPRYTTARETPLQNSNMKGG